MGYPSLVELTSGNSIPAEVVVVFTTDTGHDRLEASQLILEVCDGILQNIQLSGFPTNHLAEVASLTRLG